LVLSAAPVPRDGEKQYYSPTRVGTKWVYDLRDGEGYAQIVTKSEEKNGRYFVTVKFTAADFQDGPSTTISQYEVAKDGIFGVAHGLEDPDTRTVFDPPYCILKLPHKVGEKWPGNPGGPPRVTGKVETVKVPAGTFEAIRTEMGNDVWWYAPVVGCVKYRIGDRHYEMKSFTLPKD